MFPAVVIDLGTHVAPAEATWVLDACNAAIVAGSCELDAPASEPPHALAIVRWVGSEQRRVRIEVGLRESEHSAWSVREIVFSSGDPLRERWRSVGLVLATLVGEVEAKQDQRESGTRAEVPADARATQSAEAAGASRTGQVIEEKAEPPDAVTKAPSQSAPSSQKPSASPLAQPSAASDLASSQPGAHELARHPLVRPAAFVAGGVLAGEGADFDPLRWGGAIRAGWISPSGWVFSVAGDYSRFDLGSSLDAEWVRMAAGAGYHLWGAERWSVELSLELGARALRVVPNAIDSIQSTSWSPQAALRGEAWFQALSAGGLWAGLTASSIGRETRLLGPDRQPELVVPLIELHGMLGLWWAP
jgi:hypothetical protein